MLNEGYLALPEKDFYRDLDANAEITGVDKLSATSESKYVTSRHPYKKFKYMLDGRRPGIREAVTFSEIGYDGLPMNSYTVRPIRCNLTNNFENVRNVVINALQNQKVAAYIVIAITTFLLEYNILKRKNKIQLPNPGQKGSFQYTFAAAGLFASLCFNSIFNKKINFYNEIEESEYLATRKKNNLNERFDDLAREIPNPIDSSEFVATGILSTIGGLVTYFTYNRFCKK
jgi:hypothetical protein